MIKVSVNFPYFRYDPDQALKQAEYGHVNKSISDHYGNRTNVPLHIRNQSRILYMRNLNNWVKSILIQTYTKPTDYILDVCGGKLGDLPKWIKANIGRLYVSDISLESLKDGIKRHNDRINGVRFDTTFICCDCFSPKLLESMGSPQTTVDVVSCQFALHYSFRSEPSARQFLQNVSTLLEDGGYFIGNVPDACYIVKKCREANSNKFGNEVFSIEFTDKEPKFTPFGCTYKFTLESAIDGLEEYLVHMDILVHLAKEYGLDLVVEEDFHSFINRESVASRDNSQLLDRMKCFNLETGTISDYEWEALRIYKVFVFQKRVDPAAPPRQPRQWRSNKSRVPFLNDSDIIINL
eukprot:gene6531-7563_t